MGAHRRRQHLRRKGHEVGVDRASKNNRKLDQTRNLIEQGRVRLQGEPLGGSGRLEAIPNRLSAEILIENDMSLAEAIEIVRSAGGAELAHRQETLTECRSSGP